MIVQVKKDDGVYPVEVDSLESAKVTELRQTFGDANVSVDGMTMAQMFPPAPEAVEQPSGESDSTGNDGGDTSTDPVTANGDLPSGEPGVSGEVGGAPARLAAPRRLPKPATARPKP